MGYMERRREAAERMAGYYAEAADNALAGKIGLAVLAAEEGLKVWTDFLGRKENSIAYVAAEREDGTIAEHMLSECDGCTETGCGKCHSEPEGV